jgi:hypothetical protein
MPFPHAAARPSTARVADASRVMAVAAPAPDPEQQLRMAVTAALRLNL